MTIGEYIKRKDKETYDKLMKIGGERKWQGNGRKQVQKNISKKQRQKD